MIRNTSSLFPPTSLTELNQRLEDCLKQNSFSPLGIEGLTSLNLYMSALFCKINPMIWAYSDRNPENVDRFSRNIYKLYPAMPAGDVTYLNFITHLFKTKSGIDALIITTPTLEVEKPDALEKQIDGNSKELEQADEHSSLGLPKTIQEVFKHSPQERLTQQLLRLSNLKPSDKATQLQMILSLLYIEEKLFRKNEMLIQTVNQAYQSRKDYRQAGYLIKTPYGDAPYGSFDRQEKYSEEEWAFVLQYDKWLFEIAKNDAKIRDCTLIFLEKITKETSSTKIRTKVQQVLDYLKYQKLYKHYADLLINLYGWLGKRNIAGIYDKLGNQLVKEICPFLFVLHEMIRNEKLDLIQRRKINPEFDNMFNFKYYFTCQDLYQQWLTIRNAQQDFFKLTYGELSQLAKNQKNRLEFEKYKKNLLTSSKNKNLDDKANFYEKPFPSQSKQILTSDSKEVLESFISPQPSHQVEIKSNASKRHRNRRHTRRDLNDDVSLQTIEKKTSGMKLENSKPKGIEEPMQKAKLLPQINIATFPFARDERVMRWYNHPLKTPLDEMTFGDYAFKDEQEQLIAHVRHGGFPEADAYYHLGLKKTWLNPKTGHEDTLYIIPVNLSMPGLDFKGVLMLCMDKNGVCYHRYIHKLDDEILRNKIVHETFQINDFPELNQAHALLTKKGQQLLTPVSNHISVHSLFGYVVIENPVERMTLKLFPVNIV